MTMLKDFFLGLQWVVSVAVIVIVMSQTTKSEGLTGTIGGQMTPSFKGKPGMEEQLRTYTIYVSLAWFLVSIVTALICARLG
jgi:protein translocase SecG subunit